MSEVELDQWHAEAGWREAERLGQRAADMERERDTLRAEIERLRAELETLQALARQREVAIEERVDERNAARAEIRRLQLGIRELEETDSSTQADLEIERLRGVAEAASAWRDARFPGPLDEAVQRSRQYPAELALCRAVEAHRLHEPA